MFLLYTVLTFSNQLTAKRRRFRLLKTSAQLQKPEISFSSIDHLARKVFSFLVVFANNTHYIDSHNKHVQLVKLINPQNVCNYNTTYLDTDHTSSYSSAPTKPLYIHCWDICYNLDGHQHGKTLESRGCIIYYFTELFRR